MSGKRRQTYEGPVPAVAAVERQSSQSRLSRAGDVSILIGKTTSSRRATFDEDDYGKIASFSSGPGRRGPLESSSSELSASFSRSKNAGTPRLGRQASAPRLLSRQNSKVMCDVGASEEDKSLLIVEDSYSGATMSNMTVQNLSDSSKQPYNSIERTILNDRRAARARNPGRSPESILLSPKSNYPVDMASVRRMDLLSQCILVGGRDEAENADDMKRLGITHVLNCAQQVPIFHPTEFVSLKLPMLDRADYNLETHLPMALAFLRHVEAVEGRVLVHCIAGVSRSVCCVIMHFMREYHLDLKSAFSYIHSCRPSVQPNDGFKLTLAELELQDCGYSSVTKFKHWNFYAWNARKKTLPVKSSDYDGGDDALTPILDACCAPS